MVLATANMPPKADDYRHSDKTWDKVSVNATRIKHFDKIEETDARCGWEEGRLFPCRLKP